MHTLQHILNPLVIKDGDSWVISCPGQPFGAENEDFDSAVDHLIQDIRLCTGQIPEACCSSMRPTHRAVKILRSTSDEALRGLLASSRQAWVASHHRAAPRLHKAPLLAF